MNRSALRMLCCSLILACLAAPALSQTSPIEQLKAFRFGPDRSVLTAVATWVNEARVDPARKKEAAAALASVLGSDAAFDAKQFACRQLVMVAGEAEVPALLATLNDAKLAHYALMALARIPGAAVNDALRQQMAKRTGAVPAEIASILGSRRDAKSVGALAKLAAASDIGAADAAAAALAKIADAASLAALKQAYAQAGAGRKAAVGDSLLACALTASKTTPAAAAPVFALLNAPAAPAVLRAGALRGIVGLQGAAAVPALLTALREAGTPRQKMAAQLLRELPGPAVTSRLASALPSFSGKGSGYLIEVLADRRDPAAAPTLAKAARSSDDDTRVAALRALGSTNNPAIVAILLNAVANGMPDDRNAANDSLVLLSGKAIDEAILTVADKGAKVLRVAAIETLGRRRVPGQETRLVQAARGTDREVSVAALRVLRSMGTTASLGTLTDLILASPAGKRDEAMSTVSEIARRGVSEADRTGALAQRLAAATKPADRVDLLSVLGEVGGPRAVGALRGALGDASPDVQMAALQALAEWPTDEPLADLLKIAKTTADPARRSIALRGYTRMIGANELRPAEQTIALYREASDLTKSPAERKLVVAGLAKVKGLGALQYAAELRKDPEASAEAELAVVEIAKSTLGAYRDETKAILEPLATGAADEEVRKRAAAILAAIPKLGDYVTAWEVSPRYEQAGANYAALHDIPFAPEQPDKAGQVAWGLMPAGTSADQPWLIDLLALYGGEQKLAYLRTAVWSDAERDLVLESGSDDGTKAWWNGDIVINVNVQRAVAPAQEKTKLHLKAGWNQLMLKIPQNVMGWGAVARFTNPDGTPATGLRFAVPSAAR